MINKVTLIGHLGADPEVRTLENGTQVGRFSLATNESYKDKEGNWQKTPTEWHNIIVWRDLAERANILKKGHAVYVEGKISYRKYTDKDGVEKNLTDIVANTFRLLEKREGTGTYESRFPSNEPTTRVGTGGGEAAAMTLSNDDTPPPPANGDDLPF